jgi:hypothetical protein
VFVVEEGTIKPLDDMFGNMLRYFIILKNNEKEFDSYFDGL